MPSLLFQSAPGRAAGGNFPIFHPHHFVEKFQSAPGRAAGGNAETAKPSVRRGSFNPPPAGQPGETNVKSRKAMMFLVSIRPRPGSRGKPEAMHKKDAVIEFQSAPGRAAGGNRYIAAGITAEHIVSIRPRPGSRGKRRARNGSVDVRIVSIRPRPGSRGKRSVRGDCGHHHRFQSAPGRAAGGNMSSGCPTPISSGFNPPPAGQPGETPAPRSGRRRRSSFNPPPAGQPGETLRLGEYRRGLPSFNPPPAGQPGETPWRNRSRIGK